MADFVQFTASTPAVKPATPEVIYDKYWLSNMRIEAGDPTKPVRLIAVFSPARDKTIQVPTKDGDGNPVLDGDGNPVLEDLTYKELMQNGQPKRLVINDLFKEAALDPATLGATMQAVLTVLNTRAIAEGIL